MRKCILWILILALMLGACQKTERLSEAPANEKLPQVNNSLVSNSESQTTDAPAGMTTKEPSYKIAVYSDMHPDEPETTALLKAEEHYKGRIARLSPVFSDTHQLPEQDQLTDEALEFIADPNIKVFIFSMAGNMDDPAGFLSKLKEARPDIFYIAVYCYSGLIFSSFEDNLMDFADLELSVNQKSTAIKAVEQAKKMGARTVVDYTTPDYRYSTNNEIIRVSPEIRDAIKEECAKLNMEYVESIGPDREGMGVHMFGNWPAYDIMDRIGEYGHDTCFFSSNCRTQTVLSYLGVMNKGLVVQLCHPGLFHMMDIYNIADNENHFGDLEWTIQQMKSFVEGYKLSGRFATWRVPFSMAATTAAVEYAIAYCEGEITNKTDLDFMKICFQKAMEMYNAGDIGFEITRNAEHDNNFMFTQDYIVF